MKAELIFYAINIEMYEFYFPSRRLTAAAAEAAVSLRLLLHYCQRNFITLL